MSLRLSLLDQAMSGGSSLSQQSEVVHPLDTGAISLTPEQNLGFLHGIGRFLDVGLGGAFIRNILAGEGTQALRTLPIIGIATAPQTRYAPSGRKLLDKWLGPGDWGHVSNIPGISALFSDPGSGGIIEKGGFWDWTGKGVAGFALEVATDPTTYVGIGGLTRAGRALKAAGTADDARRILLQGASSEGFANLSKAHQKLFPTLQKMDGVVPFDLKGTWAEQAQAGQRSLFAFDVPFTAINTPLVRGIETFEAFGRAGTYLRGTGIGAAFLKKPGSATGNEVFNDFARAIVQRLTGTKADIINEANILNVQLVQLAKTFVGPNATKEEIELLARQLVKGAELSDVFKKLPKEKQNFVNIMHEQMDEFFERDIASAVHISRLDEARQAQLNQLRTFLEPVKQDFHIRAVKAWDKQIDASLKRMQKLSRGIERTERLAVVQMEDVLVKEIDKLENSVIKLTEITPERVGFAKGFVEGIDRSATRLSRSFNRIARDLTKEIEKSFETGVKSRRHINLEAQILAIEGQLGKAVDDLESALERLKGPQHRVTRTNLRKGLRQLRDRQRLIISLDEIKARTGIDARDILDAPGMGIAEIARVKQLARAGTATARQSLKAEDKTFRRLQALGEDLVAQLNPEDIGASEIRRLVPELARPLKDVRNEVTRIEKEIANLTKKNLRVDDYLTHVPTQAAREWLEKMYPERYRGAGYEFTFDHASTLRRDLPGSIDEINSTMSKHLGGADFFTTDPGMIVATRGLRTAGSEAISGLAEGVTQMKNVGMDILPKFEQMIAEGQTLRFSAADVIRGQSIRQGQEIVEDIRKVLSGEEVSKESYRNAMRELNSMLDDFTGGELAIPQNPQILEVWRRKDLTPKMFDKEIASEVDRMISVIRGDPAMLGRVERWFAKVTRPWKIGVLLPWPAYHARNFYSEWFLNFMAGMRNPVRTGALATKSLAILRADMRRHGLRQAGKFEEAAKWEDRLRQITIQTSQGPIDAADLMDRYRTLGLDEGFQRSEINMAINPIDQIAMAGSIQKAKGVIGKWAQEIGDIGPGKMEIPLVHEPLTVKGVVKSIGKSVMAVNNFVERHPRLAQFLWELEDHGRSLKDAGLEVVKRHYSYNSLAFTRFENGIRATAIPFYSWMRNNVPKMFRELYGFPRRGQTISRAFATGDFSQEELQSMPQWMREGVKIRFGKKNVIIRTGLPFEDVIEWWSDWRRKGLTSLHPGAQAVIEMGTGRRVFTGRPLGQDTFLRGVRMSDTAEALANAAIGRFGGAARKFQDMANDRLSTAEGLIQTFTGLRALPFDPGRARIQQLRDQVRRLREEGIVRDIAIPTIARDHPRATESDRELVRELRRLERAAGQRRREERGEVVTGAARRRARRRTGRERRRRGRRRGRER